MAQATAPVLDSTNAAFPAPELSGAIPFNHARACSVPDRSQKTNAPVMCNIGWINAARSTGVSECARCWWR